MIVNSQIYKLLRVVGSPFTKSYYDISAHEIRQLYHYALKNKMPLLYLEALNRAEELGSLGEEYVRLRRKYAKIEEAVCKISKKLNAWDVDYAFFKSIKPYPEVTMDIDILVFGSKYPNVIRNMRDTGYVFLARGPLSATFRDAKSEVDFDVYDEVGVSHIVYLDKDVLENFVGERKLSKGEVVRSLLPEADLLSVIAHSVLKEQMFVLSEHYTTLYYLADMDDQNLNSFLSLVDKCKLHLAVKTHLGITALLHYGAYCKLPSCLVKLINRLKSNHSELPHGIEKSFSMPYKYHPITIVKAFLEKFREEKARRSLALQALNMCNPRFTSFIIKKALYHISRQTY
jgi:hypothetical protein